MIADVRTKVLKMIPDERGRLMEILRCDDDIFTKFGQVYMTTARPGVVKAWHWHRLQTDHFACIQGTMKLVLYDARPDSPTKGEIDKFIVGDDSRLLVSIPPLVYHGFQCISDVEAIVINIPTEPYNRHEPDENRLPENDPSVPYQWHNHGHH
jgi:dTDP-4-dehydrorhamnose 3,5-epimerase